MRQLFILAILFLSAFSYAQNQSEVTALAVQLMPQNASFTINNFTYLGSTSYSIISNNSIQGFLLPSIFFNQPSLELDRDGIAKALHAYYLSQGYSPQALTQLSGVHAGLQSIKDLHRRGEAKCRVLLGTDRNPCYDFDTCQKACYSVTSFCLQVALGAGRPFVNTVWEFENNSRTLTNSYEIEQQAYAKLVENGTEWNTRVYLSSIESINKAATRASQSPLYDAYSYCFSPDYSLPVITNLQLWAQTYYQNASRFYTIYADADAVQQRSREALARRDELLRHIAPPVNVTLPQENSYANQSLGNTTTGPQTLPSSIALPFAAGVAIFLSVFFAIGMFLLLRKKPGKRK